MLGRSNFAACATRLPAIQEGSSTSKLCEPATASSPSKVSRKSRGLSYEASLNRLPLSTVQVLGPRAAKRRKLATSLAPDSKPDAPAARSADSKSVSDSVTQPDKRDELNQLMFSPTLFSPVRRPRNPIVLCHGLYGFDVRGPAGSAYQLHYWGTILEILRGRVGAEVIVSRVPGTGSVEGRAKALDAVLRKEVAGRDVNLLAHSMGGLDARYLISNIRPEAYRVLSLTTVSTPHRGSPFMEWCSSTIGLGRDGENVQESARSTLAHWMGLGLAEYFAALFDSPAYRDLLPAYLEKRFNPSVPDSPSVRYFSVAARSGELGIWHPLYWPKTVLDAAEAKAAAEGRTPPRELSGNDGLVAVESARWGEFLGVVDNCDHWRIRGSSGFRSASALPAQTPTEMPPAASPSLVASPAAAVAGDEQMKAKAKEGAAAALRASDERLKDANLKESDKALLKATAARAWSWEDVNTIVDPLRALVSPLNRLLSLVPSLTASASVSDKKSVSDAAPPARTAEALSLSTSGVTSPTTRYFSASLVSSSSAKEAERVERESSSSSLLSYFYTSTASKASGTSSTTHYIQLSQAFSPSSSSGASTSGSPSRSGLLSYFRRSPSNAPSPTTRFIQLSLSFSPKRDAPPSAFRTIPNLSSILAPPSFFGSSTQKAASRQGAAAQAGAQDAFDLERLYVALARKLHDEGL